MKPKYFSFLLKQNGKELVFVLFLSIIFTSPVIADCSERKVVRLLDRGETVADIADECDLSEDEVWEIYDGEDPEPEQNDDGYPSGTPVSQCGCWGYVRFGQRKRDQQCSSGYSVAVSCNWTCNMGGYAWGTVCE